MSEKLFERMKRFIDTNELPQKVTSSLKTGAAVEVRFEDDPEVYMVVKENNCVVCRKGAPKKPQMRIKFTEGAVDYLLEPAGTEKDNIDEYITRLSECLLRPRPEKRIEIKFYAGIITGLRMGYLGMLRFGGSKALEVLAKLGVKLPKRFMARE